MSDLVESPSKSEFSTEFKTPNMKSMNLTAEILSEGEDGANSDDERDTSVLIPTKSSPAVKLPPVKENPKIVVNKKRKLQLVADADETVEPSQVIPSKSRASSVSSKSQRVPSLNDISKPELSPPSLNLSYKSFEETSTEVLKSSPSKGAVAASVDSSRVLSSPIRLDQSNGTSTPNVEKVRDQKKDLMALRREENTLDAAIREKRKKLETLKRAKVIIGKSDSRNNEELIEKWRDAAQRASNYLLNAAIEKINKSGGKKEFERREKEKVKNNLEFTIDNSFQDRIADITNSEEYENLPEDEQERILQELEDEAEKSMRQIEKEMEEKEKNDDDDNDDEDNDADDDEFTMKDLYKRLKLDYKLVFPNQ